MVQTPAVFSYECTFGFRFLLSATYRTFLYLFLVRGVGATDAKAPRGAADTVYASAVGVGVVVGDELGTSDAVLVDPFSGVSSARLAWLAAQVDVFPYNLSSWC